MENFSVKINEVLTRGVAKIFPSKKSLSGLMKKKKIHLYFGIDPTSPNLHLGHAVILRKLREFQKLGHEVILLFGTFTGRIGDPADREESRKPLALDQIKKNMATYQSQVAKTLDIKRLQVKNNSDWLAKISFEELIGLASHFTVARLLERDMFQERIKKGKEVWVHELLYPLMQGYDSVAMDVDLEVGATDQIFNMLVGRKLQRIFHQKEKFVLATPILLGLDGRKMSKTYNNTVNLTDLPEEMYGKLMSLKDELMLDYFRLCTNLSDEEIKKIEASLSKKTINPRDIKTRLAREITAIYYDKKIAGLAEKEFNRVFQEKKSPTKIPEIKIKEKKINILDFLLKTHLCASKSEAKRLILQGGVKINEEVQDSWQKIVEIKKGMVIQSGKRKFVKLN